MSVYFYETKLGDFVRYRVVKGMPHLRCHPSDAKKHGVSVYLHRQIWIDRYGAIPAGSVIHHKDLNPLNNSLDNLQVMTIGEHVKLHALEPGAWCQSDENKFHVRTKMHPVAHAAKRSSLERRRQSERTKALWASRPTTPKSCDFCQVEFLSKFLLSKKWQRYCSKDCRIKHRGKKPA